MIDMLKCDECGHVFEYGEGETCSDPIGDMGGHIEYEHYHGCPICSGRCSQAKQCKVCGTYGIEEDDWCDECRQRVRSAFHTLVIENFSEAEIELINILYEGEYI